MCLMKKRALCEHYMQSTRLEEVQVNRCFNRFGFLDGGKGREEVGERTSVASPEVAMERGRMMGWLVGLGEWTAGL